ncbi:STAS domain-containing protein [Candidatus Sumerlaeota bacterium]|nr:STAS domain-containing protein [Candidatus Sumerlaeota bacterium]
MSLTIEIREEGESDVRLVAEGEITLKTYRQLCDAGDECVGRDPKPRRVVLDFARVGYVDSLGLGSFIKMYTSFKRAGIEMALTNLAPGILSSLRLTKLDQILPIL